MLTDEHARVLRQMIDNDDDDKHFVWIEDYPETTLFELRDLKLIRLGDLWVEVKDEARRALAEWEEQRRGA